MIEFTFRVVAKVTKDVTVLVENAGMTHEKAEELGREYAHENFKFECDGTEESYTEDSELKTYKNL
tara:strand:+ start:2240 stop:2437 length:198 start_codon:yes stop_codon:yes gene_type:complete